MGWEGKGKGSPCPHTGTRDGTAPPPRPRYPPRRRRPCREAAAAYRACACSLRRPALLGERGAGGTRGAGRRWWPEQAGEEAEGSRGRKGGDGASLVAGCGAARLPPAPAGDREKALGFV